MPDKESSSFVFSCDQTTAGEFAGRASEHVREMMSTGRPPQEILSRLAAAGEALAGPGATVSILVLDKNGLLRNGASPGLPGDYLHAIDGLKPDARVGTCAAAAATGSVVVTVDFSADDKWAELRHLPSALGFVGAWSCPIKSASGTVLGTFGTYFRNRRAPTAEEQQGVALLAAAAALVLDGYQCRDSPASYHR
ncbi:MAG TPA: GAF domain-containing protein [Verrucomicrobiales bacterium]|nr:GAF domain-containing protein [Verrucomicrobiales bacterium]